MSAGTAWRTISKVQSSINIFNPGDQILFERGGTYRGFLSIQCSGTPGSPIVFGAYGNGPLPIISGSEQVTGWTVHSGNIWKAPTSGVLDHVYFNGQLMELARYPNSGWLRNDNGTSTTLYDNALTQSNGYWNDATLVVRGTMWSYDVSEISSFSNSTLNFPSINYVLNDKDWGYFLRDKFQELDMASEWWWDENNAQLYFWPPGNANPSTVVIESSVRDNGFKVEWGRNWVEIRDLKFKHHKLAGIRIDGAANITITDCEFSDTYTGVSSYGDDNFYLNNNFHDTYASAIFIIDDNSKISNSLFNDIAMVPGLGESLWGYFGIRTQGQGNEVSHNRLENIGYIGIASEGSTLIEYNYVNNAVSILNDGGGIAFDETNGTSIQNNIVLNINGDIESAAPDHYNYYPIAFGIYFGNVSITNTTIQNNTVANCAGTGIHVDHTMLSQGNKILDNVIYNNGTQITFSDFSNYNGPGATLPYFMPSFDTEVFGNTFCSLARGQETMKWLQVWTSDHTDFGIFDDNIYYNPFNEQNIVVVDNFAGNIHHRYTLAKWQDETLEDPNSLTSPFWMDEYEVTDTLTGNLIDNGDFNNGLTNTDWWPLDANVSIDQNALGSGDALKVEFLTDNTYYELKVNHSNDAPVQDGEMYLLRYKSKGTAHGEFSPIYKPNSQTWSQEPMMHRFMPLDATEREQGFVFPATLTDNGRIYFNQHWTEPTYWIDDLGLYKVNVVPVEAQQMIVLHYNDTDQSSTVVLTGCWSLLDGTIVSGSIDLDPFMSVVLRKMDDSDCSSIPDPGTGQMFNIKMFLQGSYNVGAGLMSDDLRTGGHIPLVEPYSALGFNLYGDGGGETIDASVLNVTGNDAIVDWVLVEVRDNNDPSIILTSRAALLQRDGDIVDLDGVSFLSINTNEQWVKVAVRHRVHLGILTFYTVVLGSGSASIDFTDPALAMWGTNATDITSNNKRVLWTGNAITDQHLKYTGSGNDRDIMLAEIGGDVPTQTVSGYSTSDVNMDGIVKYTGADNDRDPILQNIGGVVPTSVRLEQLP